MKVTIIQAHMVVRPNGTVYALAKRTGNIYLLWPNHKKRARMDKVNLLTGLLEGWVEASGTLVNRLVIEVE